MDVSHDSQNTDDVLPVLASNVKQFFDLFAQQANNRSNELPIELTNTTGTYLQNLNEDCLLEIFSVKSLTLTDLCSLVETCTLFQRITQRVFPKDLSIAVGDNGYYCVASRKYSHIENRSSQDIERIFKNFGSCLSEVSISSNLSNRTRSSLVLNLLTEYCVDKLESLRIKRMEIPAVLTVKLKPMLKRLQLLHLENVSIEGDNKLIVYLDSLIELKVRWVKNDSAILRNIFPKLERFTYHVDDFRIDHRLSTFISCHRSLKKLCLKICIDDAFKMNFLQVIGSSCKELEELELGPTKVSSLQPLQTLQSLKILKLCRVSCEDFQFIAALTNLRELHLDNCRLPTDPTQFAFLTQLTQLHIIGGWFTYGWFDLVDMIRQLTKLEKLKVSGRYKREGRFVLDKETFLKIVDVVEERPNVLTLKCNFNFDLNICDENRMVRLLE